MLVLCRELVTHESPLWEPKESQLTGVFEEKKSVEFGSSSGAEEGVGGN